MKQQRLSVVRPEFAHRLEQLKTRFPSMVKQAGYEEIAERIDQQTITDQLTRLEREIIAKY